MVPGVGGPLRHRYVSYTDDGESDEGWNGWLYPFLFIILPTAACLMVIGLIICNIIGHYRKKREMQQFLDSPNSDGYYPQNVCFHHTPSSLYGENPLDSKGDLFQLDGTNDKMDEILDYNQVNNNTQGGKLNEIGFTYNVLYGNHQSGQNQQTLPPVRPMSGWNG